MVQSSPSPLSLSPLSLFPPFPSSFSSILLFCPSLIFFLSPLPLSPSSPLPLSPSPPLPLSPISPLSSPSSSLWKQLPTTQRRELLEGGDKGKEDGEFWMSYDDFRKHYTDFEICNICMEQLYEDETGQGSKVSERSKVKVSQHPSLLANLALT